MAPRIQKLCKFALFYMEYPPSADVLSLTDFNDIDIKTLKVGTTCNITRNKKRINGKIVAMGTRKYLKGLHVTAAGVVHEKPEENMYYVLTRRQEKCKQKRAREENLNQMGLTLFEKGPEGLPAQPRVIRTGKKRPEGLLAKIEAEMEALPCLKKGPGDKEIVTDGGVFMNKVRLYWLKRQHEDNPSGLFRALLEELVPKWMVHGGGISLSGRRGTVKLSEKVMAAITTYTDLNASGMPYDPVRVAKDYLYNHAEKHPQAASALTVNDQNSMDLACGTSESVQASSPLTVNDQSSMDLSSGTSESNDLLLYNQ